MSIRLENYSEADEPEIFTFLKEWYRVAAASGMGG
jgi:hypothetical protein